MKYTLRREQFRPDGIFSKLIDDRSQIIANTAEHAYNSLPKLPDGTYTCLRGIHKLHDLKPFETFEIMGVPGHTGVLFHVGNWPQVDSDGCVLLGEGVAFSKQGQMITASRQTFQAFMDKLAGIDQFELVVES